MQMISAHYEENPDSFHEEIKQLDQLREVRVHFLITVVSVVAGGIE